MKKTILITLILLLLTAFAANSFAQSDTTKNKTVIKYMTIVNGDTTISEKTITEGNGNGSFRIFDDGKETFFDFNAKDSDSLFNSMMKMFQSLSERDLFQGFNFSFDTSFFENFKMPFPDSLLKPGKQIYPKDSRDMVRRTPVLRNVSVEDFSNGKKVSPIASEFIVIPDPTDGTFTISFPRDHKKESTVQISPLEGNSSYKEIVEPGKSDYQRRFDLRDYPSGIYIISLKQGKQSASKKLVIQ
ncbi:MAG: T9SS type A sorting domain-containing protein [Bacteroidota bacterium]